MALGSSVVRGCEANPESRFLTDMRTSYAVQTSTKTVILFIFAQVALEIPAAISDADNLDPRFQHTEGDCRPTLKADGAQAGQNIVAALAAFREGCQPHTHPSNPTDIPNRDLWTAIFGNIVVERGQVGDGVIVKNDLMRHAWRLSSAERGALLAA